MEFNRHAVWNSAPEAEEVQKEIDEIHTRGRNQPAIQATLHGEFATSWFNQLWHLLYRGSRAHWRTPTYLMAKMILNIFAGLFIGVRLRFIILPAYDESHLLDSSLSSKQIIPHRDRRTSSSFVSIAFRIFPHLQFVLVRIYGNCACRAPVKSAPGPFHSDAQYL